MQTTVGVGSPRAVKRWATDLAIDVEKEVYFNRFIAAGKNSLIQKRVDLESDSGDRISFDLMMRQRGEMVYGDANIVGKEEDQKFYTDEVLIDQARKGASAGGAMSRKRTLHDLRALAKENTALFIAEWQDDLFVTYLAGDSTFAAYNTDRKVKASFAGNPVQAPDTDHLLYGGAATSKLSLVAGDKVSYNLIERLPVKARMMNPLNPDVVRLSPISIEGDKHFVFLMSPFQEFDLRTEVGDATWAGIGRAAATQEGRKGPIFRGGTGMINDVVLHTHENVCLFNDYGAGANVPAARALLLGRQAGVVAYGSAGSNTRYSWVEELTNAKNNVDIYCGVIMGFKKTRFNGYDLGVIAVDTAAKNPN